jgi:hypothetical protein
MSARPAVAANDDAAPKRKPKRQRVAPLSVRYSPGERATLELKARDAGYSTAAYVRHCTLGEAGPRSRRAPTLNAELLAHALAGLNKVGSNLNQIAHKLNAGRAVSESANAEALAELRAVLMDFKAALGRNPRP